MGYIGRDNRLTTFTKQSITANGTLTDFTLEQGVGDSSSILVSVGGVVQQPDVAYSATGKTLSFTSAPGIGTPVWVVYLGKELHSTFAIPVSSNADSQTGVGDGTTTPLTLSHSVTNPQSIIVTLNGVAQEPTTDFTVSGTTLTFTTAPDATSDIMIYFLELETADDYIHDGSVTTSSFAASDTMPAWNGSALTNLTAGNLVGNLGAFDGSNLTNVPYPIIKSTVDPTINENPGNGLGTLFLNHTTGNMWALTNATADQNVWTNVGSGTGHVENTNPSEANNPGPFTWNDLASYQVIFAGATDPDSGGTVTHYKVDTITPDTYLSVSVEEVAAGQPHTFVVADVPSNQNVTFRVRAKDNDGGYSSGITVSATLVDIVYTIATGGIVPAGQIAADDDDYKYHIFQNPVVNQFSVSQVGTDNSIEYLIIAGGGGGSARFAGGSGAGGYLTGNTNIGVGNYTIDVGAGGSPAPNAPQSYGDGGVGGNSSAFGITTYGGGISGHAGRPQGLQGGSGGGSSKGSITGFIAGGVATPAGQGHDGGDALAGGYGGGGGGGGAGAQGGNTGPNNTPGGAGGSGLSSNITGTPTYRAGGGGGSAYYTHPGAGPGGNGGGGRGAGGTGEGLGGGVSGDQHTGSGGGGGNYVTATSAGGAGGSGLVIVRYKYK